MTEVNNTPETSTTEVFEVVSAAGARYQASMEPRGLTLYRLTHGRGQPRTRGFIVDGSILATTWADVCDMLSGLRKSTVPRDLREPGGELVAPDGRTKIRAPKSLTEVKDLVMMHGAQCVVHKTVTVSEDEQADVVPVTADVVPVMADVVPVTTNEPAKADVPVKANETEEEEPLPPGRKIPTKKDASIKHSPSSDRHSALSQLIALRKNTNDKDLSDVLARAIADLVTLSA